MLCRRCPTYKICVPTAGCCQPPNPVGQALPAHPSHTRFGLIQVAENLRAAQSKRLPYSHHLAPLFRTIIPWYTWYILWAALFYVRYSYSHVRGFVKHFCCTAVRNVSPCFSISFFLLLLLPSLSISLWAFLSSPITCCCRFFFFMLLRHSTWYQVPLYLEHMFCRFTAFVLVLVCVFILLHGLILLCFFSYAGRWHFICLRTVVPRFVCGNFDFLRSTGLTPQKLYK